MTWFDALCRRRSAAGIREYRGGDPDAVFVGDPLAERLQELADAANYQVEAARAEGLSADPAEWPSGWHGEWLRIRESAEWTRRRILERDKRVDGGIAWQCGDLVDEAGRG